MRKTLLTATLIAVLSMTSLSANAFCWSNLNPFTWGSNCCGAAADCGCNKNKCQCKKQQKSCPVKNQCKTEKPKCNSCTDAPTTCNPCDKLQQETERP